MPGSQICRYFLKGTCTRNDCPFSHDTKVCDPCHRIASYPPNCLVQRTCRTSVATFHFFEMTPNMWLLTSHVWLEVPVG
jgi:hypothetical protein